MAHTPASSPQPNPNGLVPVILSKRLGSRFPGDVASFTPEKSRHLVASDSAKYVKLEEDKPEPAKK